MKPQSTLAGRRAFHISKTHDHASKVDQKARCLDSARLKSLVPSSQPTAWCSRQLGFNYGIAERILVDLKGFEPLPPAAKYRLIVYVIDSLSAFLGLIVDLTGYAGELAPKVFPTALA
jgi:hypothetical protein